jgi:RNA polymerase sigma-70 factor (ECF subfamily)
VSQSIEDLYQRFGPVVYRRARKLLGDDQAAWDALQEVFIRALRGREAFRGDASPTTWLYRITTNYCFNVLRDHGRRTAKLRDHHAAAVPMVAPDDPELRVSLLQLIDQLPPELCEIAVYSYIDRMTQDEIAAVVGVSPRTVGNRLQEFLERARALWASRTEAAQ